MLDSKKFLNTLDKSEKVVLACSGGPDSMFLLALLLECRFSVVVAHVNHKMRAASEDEYVFMEKYCKEKGVIFEGTTYNSGNVDNFQNDARIFRYNFFASLIKKYHAKYLFTAHHGDDLMETVLMRLNRGSSIRGYSGIKLITEKKDYKIVRPLLYMTKDEISEYNDEFGIPYVLDESNMEDHYTRNRYRHKVLPFLKEENKNSHLKFLEFSEKLNKCSKFIDNYAKKIIGDSYKDNVLDLRKLKEEDDFIVEYIIEELVNILYPDDLYEVDGKNVKEIMKAIKSDKPNIKISLPNKKEVRKEYDKLIFEVQSSNFENYDILLKDCVEIDNFKIYFKEEDEDTSNYTIRLNSKEIKLPIHVRSRNIGDKMEVKNMTGTKKISDIFIDQKIPKQIRDIYPIVTDNNGEILWIPGIKKSKKDVSINECYDIIIKYEKKEK